MDAKKKKILITSVSIIAVVGILFIAYKQWGSNSPLFGPGRVDKESKQKRTSVR